MKKRHAERVAIFSLVAVWVAVSGGWRKSGELRLRDGRNLSFRRLEILIINEVSDVRSGTRQGSVTRCWHVQQGLQRCNCTKLANRLGDAARGLSHLKPLVGLT
jgi:hypothetical protein